MWPCPHVHKFVEERFCVLFFLDHIYTGTYLLLTEVKVKTEGADWAYARLPS